uniref:Uncharacterized protein n=1 Tax=viral metagenome TaxID=1070528 RepID=A0A6C0DIC1_9ZZZZ
MDLYLDDLFNYLMSPYLEYPDYRNNSYCGDVCIQNYDEGLEGLEGLEHNTFLDFESLREDLLFDYYQKEGYCCETGLDHCDFSKENNPNFINELKLYFEMFDNYFSYDIEKIDFNKNDKKHYLYRILIPNTRVNKLKKFVNNLFICFIKLIICGKLFSNI